MRNNMNLFGKINIISITVIIFFIAYILLIQDPTHHIDYFPETNMIFQNDSNYEVLVKAYFAQELIFKHKEYKNNLNITQI